MAANNYFGAQFGTQYTAAGAAGSYPQTGGFAVAPGAPTGYAQRPGYPGPEYAAAQQAATTAPAAPYDYGYGRAYDASKTYYQQAGAPTGYTTPQNFDTANAAKVLTGFQAATSYAPARATIQQPAKPSQFTTQTYVAPTTYSATATTANTAGKPAANTTAYSNYDAALYSAATMYVAQQNTKGTPVGQSTGWQGYKKPGGAGIGHQTGGPGFKNKFINKKPPQPQQLHYCDVCKISCAGPQTYREHLDGQKHKKREAAMKAASDPATTQPAQTQSRASNSLVCELCDVTCTGNDAYAAHVRGAKHQKVVKLHTRLGKPIPSSDPTPSTTKKEGEDAEEEHEDNVKPVGVEYIEEMKDDEGKILSFNCKLCECKFNDPNAKEMHMKGRRHRLQYKKKVQPDLVVDFKPNLRLRKIQDAKAHRQAMQEEFWNRRRGIINSGGGGEIDMNEEERMFWDAARGNGYEDYPYRGGYGRGGRPIGPLMGGHPFFGMMPGRRPESSDDRHVVARHAEIYPKEEALQTIQRIVSHTERALKLVSDAMTTETVAKTGNTDVAKKVEQQKESKEDKENKEKTNNENNQKDANAMISFQKDAEGSAIRLLKGVMRVGLLAKGLLLQGDVNVQLVVLCAEKPTTSLLKRVVTELPIQLKKISEEHKYTVVMAPVEGAILVSDATITVKVSLTSPLLREQDQNNSTSIEQPVQNTEDLLPREPCLQALAALRHAKWFQARATGLQSCVMIMRIMRDMCQRIPTWATISQWAMELFIEKIISSAGLPLSPGECLRRVMEAFSSGVLINGPGILDPCEKDPQDALATLSKQQREDITGSAQQFLRFIAFRQIHKVLGMDQMPPMKISKFSGQRFYRFNRKRRRSGTEVTDAEADGKMVKKDAGKAEGEVGAKVETMETETAK